MAMKIKEVLSTMLSDNKYHSDIDEELLVDYNYMLKKFNSIIYLSTMINSISLFIKEGRGLSSNDSKLLSGKVIPLLLYLLLHHTTSIYVGLCYGDRSSYIDDVTNSNFLSSRKLKNRATYGDILSNILDIYSEFYVTSNITEDSVMMMSSLLLQNTEAMFNLYYKGRTNKNIDIDYLYKLDDTHPIKPLLDIVPNIANSLKTIVTSLNNGSSLRRLSSIIDSSEYSLKSTIVATRIASKSPCELRKLIEDNYRYNILVEDTDGFLSYFLNDDNFKSI